jgi:hypothetical protein
MIRLSDGENSHVMTVEGADNREWGPDSISVCQGQISLPDYLVSGEYQVAIGLKVERHRKEWLELPLADSLRLADGFYRVATVRVK